MLTQLDQHTTMLDNEPEHTLLQSINGISFTSREVDVIACIVGGRGSKKIASFLMISHKTVDVHIRNVMLKLQCNSRGEIIDFIEKSHQFLAIKSHYTNLLIKATFEKELKKIAQLNSKFITCMLFHASHKTLKVSFVEQLSKHLSLAKININNKIWKKNKALAHITKNNTKEPINCVLYIISKEFISELETTNADLMMEIANIKELLKANNCKVIFLVIDEIVNLNFKQNIEQMLYLDLTKIKNYYFMVFELIQMLLPNLKNEKNIAEFKNQYATLNGDITLKDTINKHLPVFSNSINKIKSSHPSITRFLPKLTIITAFIICMIGIFFVSQNNRTLKAEDPDNIADVQNNQTLINIPQRNLNFTGRKHILSKIWEQLENQNIGVVTQTVSGLGGVGKTQLATEFAYQAAATRKYALINWISAETVNNIHNSYKNIAQYLQLNITGLELESIKTLVHRELATKYKNSKILFVLDNVPEHETIREYLTTLHKDLGSIITLHVLITSRSQYWPESKPFVLNVFSNNEALSYVKKNLPDETENNQQRLITTLKSFPLALGQAVAYIKKHTNINDYLELYVAKQKDYLDQSHIDRNQYTESLWKTWNITIDKLSKQSQELLLIAAYLDPDDIPFRLFDNITTEQRSISIEELRKYSFITLTNNNSSFKMHRLLQEVIRLSIKSNCQKFGHVESHWLKRAISLINRKFDFDYLQPNKWQDWSRYLSSANILSIHAIKLFPDTLKLGTKLYIKYTMFLTYIQYDGKQAIKPWNKILNLLSNDIKAQNSALIAARINTHISNALNWSGKATESYKLLLNNVLPIYQRQLPILKNNEQRWLNLLRIIRFKNNDMTDEIKNKCDLNFSLVILGNTQHQIGLVKDALKSYKNAFGLLNIPALDNTSMLYKAYSSWFLSNMYLDLGQFVKAESILAQTNGLEKLYENHPRQAQYYATTANLMYHLGKFDVAENLLKQCATVRRNNFSEQHIKHATTLIHTGLNNLMLKKTAEAEQNFIAADKLQKLFDPKFIPLRVNLGLWKTYESIGNYDKALYYTNETFKTCSMRYKHNIHTKMSFQLSQAEAWPSEVKFKDLKYWQNALLMNQKIFGTRHYQTAKCHYMLGLNLQAIPKTNKLAIKHYKHALQILNMLENRHPDLQPYVMKNIALVQSKLI